MFFEVIDDTRKSVLNRILTQPPIKDMYLAGGTALAFQLGHRESIDFDWFTTHEFHPEDIESSLGEMGELLVAESKRNTFHGYLRILSSYVVGLK